jgi:hypothetical protein
MSILSVTSLGSPTQNPALDLAGFRFAIDWILDYSAANIPSPTSIAEQFFVSQRQLQSIFWSPVVVQHFYSIIAFPFWSFNANNFGSMEESGTGITPNLPKEFYVTASVSVPHSKIVISTAMFSIFLTLQVILHLFIWGVFAWLCIKRPLLPAITSYPLFDFAFKTTCKPVRLRETQHYYHLSPPSTLPTGRLGASDGDVLSILENCTHTLRSDDDLVRLEDQNQQRLAPATRLTTR